MNKNRTESKHLTGQYGILHLKANYWTYYDDKKSYHSVQSSDSGRMRMSNEYFAEALRIAVRRGAAQHNIKYKKTTSSYWTYSIIDYYIEYKGEGRILYNAYSRQVFYYRKNKPLIVYDEDVNIKQPRKYVLDEERKNMTDDRKLRSERKALKKREYAAQFKKSDKPKKYEKTFTL